MAEQDEQSHADAIRQYWTPERIRSAKPKDNDYDASGKKQAGGTDYDMPIEIKNSTRKTFPYQCVGKLVFTQKGDDFQGTAYALIWVLLNWEKTKLEKTLEKL